MRPLVKFKDRKATTLIIIHDSHTTPDVCKVHDVPRWAELARIQGLEMGLLEIGYHDIIERDGELVECRRAEAIGTHTPGLNMESYAICLVGGREVPGGDGVDNFTKAQKRTLLRRLHELTLRYPGAAIKGHTEVQRFRRANHPPCPPFDMDLLREDVGLYAQGIIL